MSGSPGKKLVARALGKLLRPLTPARSRIALRYWLTGLDGTLEDELRFVDRLASKGAKGVAIDVGANYGLFSYRLASLFQKVYAFEINPGLTGELAAFNPGNVEIVPKGLSSNAGRAILYIPLQDGRELHGWASLAPGNCPGVSEHVEKPVEIVTLDSFALSDVSFLKMDVEGHEVEALKGAVETLKRCRPTVMVEVKDRNVEAVVAFFLDLGYERKTLAELIGVEGSEENLLFVPTTQA